MVVGTVGAGVAIVTGLIYVGVSHYNLVTETSLQPRAVLQDPGVDPRLVSVGVTWTQEGWCVGEFHVKAFETSSQVKVDAVIDRQSSNGMCAGVGAVNQMAWADLQLSMPLGTRPVVRGDGTTLPYWTSGDGLVRRGPEQRRHLALQRAQRHTTVPLAQDCRGHGPGPARPARPKAQRAAPFFAPQPMNCPFGEGAYYLIALHYLDGGDMTLKAEDRGSETVVLVASNRTVAWAATTPGFYPLLTGLLGE
jgi:hypothetical protein